jgi:hypothetical protein
MRNWARASAPFFLSPWAHPIHQHSINAVPRKIWRMGSLSRAKLIGVGAGYAAVLAASAFLVFWRYLQYRWHPDDANQYSGMWAGGDMVLGVFIFLLFLVPTFFLVLVLRKSEAGYIGYAKVLLIVSLTAPTSVGLFAIPWLRNSNSLLGWVCMWRLFGSPFVLVGIVGSRLLARFPRAKRLCSYAALVEAGTLGAMILLLGVAARLHR